jgi:hypothetical protein
MKKMTCKEMGGSCDAVIEGNTAEEMALNGGKHLTEMSEKDAGHKRDKEVMDASQNDPEHIEKWMADFKTKFEALPEA